MSIGKFYTVKNIFKLPQFKEWFESNQLYTQTILEPFAGSNNLLKFIAEDYKIKFYSCDIDSQEPLVECNDSLLNFPKGYKVCITNPPYAASNKCKSYDLKNKYIDLYEKCLDLILKHCEYAAVLVPSTYLQNSKLHINRLHSYTLLEQNNIYSGTNHPTCLLLFNPHSNDILNFSVYSNENYLGIYNDLLDYFKDTKIKCKFKFIENKGNVLIHKIDSNYEYIKFYNAFTLNKDQFNYRSWCKIQIDDIPNLDIFIELLNKELYKYREYSKDIQLSVFKNLNNEGKFRKRIDNNTIQLIINKVLNEHYDK